MEAFKLLFDFLAYALPKVPGIDSVFKDFWGANNLGPMPPDVAKWLDVDRRIDQERAKEKESQ